MANGSDANCQDYEPLATLGEMTGQGSLPYMPIYRVLSIYCTLYVCVICSMCSSVYLEMVITLTAQHCLVFGNGRPCHGFLFGNGCQYHLLGYAFFFWKWFIVCLCLVLGKGHHVFCL